MALRSVPTPEPADGAVLLQVRGAALGFPDVLLVRGGYQVCPDLPFIPGAEGESSSSGSSAVRSKPRGSINHCWPAIRSSA
jgi:NADPH2:quinone reductase